MGFPGHSHQKGREDWRGHLGPLATVVVVVFPRSLGHRLAVERRSRSVHRGSAQGAQECSRPFCLLQHVLDTGRVKKVPTGKAGCINASSFHVLQTERTLPPPIPFWFLTPKNMFAGKGRFLVRGSFAHRLSLLLKSSKERLPISYQARGLATLLRIIRATLGCTTGGGASASTSSGTGGVTGVLLCVIQSCATTIWI